LEVVHQPARPPGKDRDQPKPDHGDTQRRIRDREAAFTDPKRSSASSEELSMGSILPFIRKAGIVFDDRVTLVIGEAFDSACKELHDSGQPAIVYEVIARRIMDAAKQGERDIRRLL
jgi:hypothetical protein